LEIRLGYRVKSFIDASRFLQKLGLDPWSVEAVVSPYDFESIIYRGVLHPRMTPGSVASGEWRLLDQGYIASYNGLSIAGDRERYRVSVGGEEYTASRAVYSSIDGALVVAFMVGKYTSIAQATPDNLVIYRDVYRGEPVECSIGYASSACVFRDGCSIVVHSGGVARVGFPARAVATLGDGSILVESGGWLVRILEEDVKPLTRSNGVFRGLLMDQPLFLIGDSLRVLSEASLVEVARVNGGEAWGFNEVIVLDKGSRLEVLDARGRPEYVLEKDPSVKCWATRSGVVCCRRSFCGLIEPGESLVGIEPVKGEAHSVVLKPGIPVDLGKGFTVSEEVITEEAASILRPHLFRLTIRHLLGDTVVEAESPGLEVGVRGEATAHVSTGRHRCGGVGVLEVKLEHESLPRRVKLYVSLGNKVIESAGSGTICIDRLVNEVLVEAVDEQTGDRVVVARIPVKAIHIPPPVVRHSLTSSGVVIESDAVIEETLLCYRDKCIRVKHPVGNRVHIASPGGMEAPGYIIVRLGRNGFTYTRRIKLQEDTGGG